MEQQRPVSKIYYTLAGFGATAFWWMSNLRTYFGAFFITDILKMPATVFAVATSISTIVNLLAAPTISIIMEKGKPGKWGKLRKWMIICPIMQAVFFSCSFIKISDNVAVMTAWITVCWTMNAIMMAATNTPYWSLHALIATSPAERTAYVSKRNFWVNAGKLVYSASYIFVIAWFAKIGGSEVLGYTYTAVCLALLNILMFFLEFKLMGNAEAKLEEMNGQPVESKKTQKGPSMKEILKNFLTNGPFALVCVVRTGFAFGAGIRSALYIYYYNAVIGNAGLYAMHLSIASIMGIAATLSLPFIAKKLENKQIAGYSFGLQVLCCIGMKFFLVTSPYIGLTFSMLYEFCSIVNGSIAVAMFSDTAVYAEWKTGVNTMTAIMGGQQMVGAVISLISANLVAWVLTSTGYNAGTEATVMIKEGIVKALSMYPMIICALASVASWLNPLSNAKLIKYQEEINERKKAVI